MNAGCLFGLRRGTSVLYTPSAGQIITSEAAAPVPTKQIEEPEGIVVLGSTATVISNTPGTPSGGAIAIGGAIPSRLLKPDFNNWTMSPGALAVGQGAIAIGGGGKSDPVSNVAGAVAAGDRCIAIGGAAPGSFGSGAKAQGTRNIAIGSEAAVGNNSSNSIGIGHQAAVNANWCVVIGGLASGFTGSDQVVIGANAQSSGGTEQVIIGGGSNGTQAPSASAQGAICIGSSGGTAINGARVTGTNGIAIGSGSASAAGASAAGADGIAIGRTSTATIADAVAIGRSANVGTNVPMGIAIGLSANANGLDSDIAIGSFSRNTSGAGGVAIGGGDAATRGATTSNYGAVAIGGAYSGNNGAVASGLSAIAIGGSGDISSRPGPTATTDDAIAIGRGANATHINATALGQGVATTATNQVNLGTKRLFAGVPTTAPADANLIAGQVSFWVDEAANTLTVKVKYSNGTTVKSGTVALV